MAQNAFTVYIGTYTHTGAKGVYRAELAADGRLRLIDCVESASPTYLAYSPDKKYIYAANESHEGAAGAGEGAEPGGTGAGKSAAHGGAVTGEGATPGGAVTAFEVQADGSLIKVACRPTGGPEPCHVLAHGGWLYTANYGAGNITAFPLSGGVPAERAFTHQHFGSGPDASRQQGPHAHCAVAVPGTDAFCAVDLGIDQARFYRRDGDSLSLVQALQLPGGSGPRHAVFSGDGRTGWIVTELSNEIFAIKYGSEWAITGSYPTLPPGFDRAASNCAAIRLSPDGGLIAASNRGHDSVACFAADAETGALELKGIYPLGGKHPRDINFSPDGKWLLSANQESDAVAVLSAADGFRLVDGAALALPKPACILF